MTGSFPVADHLRCLASASSDILTDIPFLVTAFWDRTPFQRGLLSVTITLLDEIREATESESSSHNQAHVAKSISSTHPITY
jgi:hypothetical protein